MTDKVTNLTLKAQVDQSLAAQGVKALKDLQAASDGVQSSFEKIDSASRSFDVSTESADANAKAIANLRDQYIQAADAADKLAASSADAADAGSGGGSGVGNLRTVGRALNQVGLGDIGRPIQQIGDLGIIVKELGAVSEVTSGSIDLQTVATGALEMVLSPVVLILAAVALAFIDLKLILDLIKKGADEAAAAEKAQFDQEEAQRAQTRSNRAAAQNTSTEQNQNNVNDNFQSAQDYTTAIASKKGQITKNQSDYDALGSSFNPAERAKLAAEADQLKKDLDQLETEQNTFYQTSENAAKNLQPMIDKVEAQKKAQDDLLKSADDLIAQRKEEQTLDNLTSAAAAQKLTALKADTEATTEARDKLKESGDTSKTVTDKIAAYNQTLADNAAATKYLTDTAIPEIKAREDENAAAKDQIKAQTDLAKATATTTQINQQLAQMEADRAKQVQTEAADDARNAERSAIENSYAAQIAAAKEVEAVQAERDKGAQAEIAAEQKLADDKAKIIDNEHDSELKAYQSYIDAEQKQTDQANRQRLQTLETAQNDLKNLAASGDVAGFVTRSNQAKLDLKHQAENASDADKQLYDNYQKQVQAARDAEAKQLSDLTNSFDQQKAVRDKAEADRIAQIEAAGQLANTKSGQLEQQLNDIREQWRKDDLARQRAAEEQSYDDKIAVEQQKSAEALNAELAAWNQFIADIEASGSNALSNGGGHTQVVPMATGATITRDGILAKLHEGERVLNRRENSAYTYGQKGGGDTIQVTVQNTVGDVATKSMLDEYQQTTIDGVVLAHQRAKGRRNP